MDRLQTLSLADFVDDQPWGDDIPLLEDVPNGELIAGVRIQRLTTRADKRGDLTVLMSSLL